MPNNANCSQTNRTSSIFELKIESISFVYFFFMSIKPLVIFLFFKKNAVFGTFVGSSLSLFVLLFILPYLIRHGFPTTVFIWSIPARRICIFLFLITISLAWTQASSRYIAFAYNCIYLSDVLVVLILMKIGEPSKIAIEALKGLILGTSVLALAIFCFAGITVDNRLGDNEFLHPNTIGKNMGFATLACYYMIMNKNDSLAKTLFWSTICLLLLLTLLLSLSKTSIIGICITLVLVILISSGNKSSKVLILLSFLFVFLLAYNRLESYIYQYMYQTQGGEALSTASGRVLIWVMSWDMIKTHPLFGHGFLSFRDAGPQIATVRLVHAHNEIIHLLFSYGFLGVISAISVYFSFYSQLCHKKANQMTANEKSLGLGILFFSLIQGLFTADVIGLVFPLPLLLILSLWYSNLPELSERDLS